MSASSRLSFSKPGAVSGCGPWCEPLHMVERVVGSHPDGKYFDVDHFGVGVTLHRRGRPDIFLYKHYFTRRYLNLDAAGHAYRYHPPRSDRGSGQYRRHRDLHAAIDDLHLWELPYLAGNQWTGTLGPRPDTPRWYRGSRPTPSTDRYADCGIDTTGNVE